MWIKSFLGYEIIEAHKYNKSLIHSQEYVTTYFHRAFSGTEATLLELILRCFNQSFGTFLTLTYLLTTYEELKNFDIISQSV